MRFLELDRYRYLAVTLALVSHAILNHTASSVIDHADMGEIVRKALTRMATPSLIFLFGVMAEVVYRGRYEKDSNAVERSLIKRAFFATLRIFHVLWWR